MWRKWAEQSCEKKVSTLLIHSNIHGDDEGSVEVSEDVLVDKNYGGMMLEENDCDGVRHNEGGEHDAS